MKYIGEFKDIANETIHMELNTGGSNTTNVEFADEPIVLSVDGGESHIYKPVRYSNASIRIFSQNYNFDLYARTSQQNKVVISKAGSTIWTGYLTSNLYNVGYENEEEIIELEAIDALSTLQYYKYTPVNGERNIVSFTEIINKLILRCNAYTEFYISDSIQLSSNDNVCFIDTLHISEQNFFDEDDEAMKMDEVLEGLCKYLGLCCCTYGDKVYFVDYDAVKSGLNTYYKFIVGDILNPTKVTLSHTKNITAGDYTENGGQLSLDNVYNKVTVKDSLYSFDSIIPSIWDDAYLTNYNGSGHIEEVNEDGKGGMHKCFFKYYKHTNYKSYYYDKKTLLPISPSKINYAFTQNYVGATICRHFSEKVTDYNAKYNDINFTDYVLLHCHNTTNVDDTVKRKLFTLEINNSKASFLGGSTYLVVKGSFRYMDRENEMYIMEGYMNKDDDFDPMRLFIWARLEYGGLFWDGNKWTSTPADFKLFYDSGGQTDHCINQVFQVKNNITWEMGLDGEEGYAIPMPSKSEVVLGKPTFTLYEPYKLDKSYRCDAVWLSNFDIVARVQNLDSDVDKDSDTEYSNVINEDYIKELDNEEFKICTWDNKEANYSAVAYKLADKFSYLDKVYNKINKLYLRMEEHYIYRLVKQYTDPSIRLKLNLLDEYMPYSTVTDRYLQGKIFIVDSQEINLLEKKTAITLIEKK